MEVPVDLDAMKSIVAIAEQGSISRAAVELNITQSALSRRIKGLEERYGQVFLDRAAHPGTLTPAGKALLDKAREFIRTEQDLVRQLRTLDNRGGISFSCTLPFGISYLSDILKDMVFEQGGMDEFKFVFLRQSEVLAGLRRKVYDLVLVEHDIPLELEGVQMFSLPEDEISFLATPGMFNGFVDLQQLLAQRLYCKQVGSCSRTLLERFLQMNGKTIEDFSSRVFFDDFSFLVREIAAGKGISFMPCSIVRNELARGEVVACELPDIRFMRPRTLVVPDTQLENERLKPFIRRIFNAFQMPVPSYWE